jgi:hypothetical protein
MKNMMASAPDAMDERDQLSQTMFGKPIDLLTPEEMDMLNDEADRLMQKFSSAPDAMDERNQVMENIAMQEFGKPLNQLSEDEIIQIEMMIDEMVKRKDQPRKMASMDDDYEQEFMKLVEEFMMNGFSQQEAIEAAKDEIERQRTKFMATGGRVGYQTGGVTESRTLPPEYVEALGKTYAADLTRQAGMPTVTNATAQQPGETAQQFANRQAQAQQFGITQAGMAELAPQVAAQDPLQAAAYAQAIDPTKGLGSYQPFLTAAGQAATGATALTGTGAGTGAGSIQSYMSPYQQQVIDTTMADFDQQAQIRANQQAAAALGTPGAFGGGREGV